MAYDIQEIALHETAQTRYLNYAMSVITSRALPDVRDGLKPVQRRILYAMFQNLGLKHTSKHRKSAAVIGEVMAKYHPHGDQSIYDAMVRQAQDFSMRYPLVDGQGNFGSLDGDNAAAMRYTEARMTELSEQLLDEIRKNTVAFQDNYDNTTEEPIVLPAQIPNLLINGATGIAVGMATNIPPHNLGEVVGALLKLVDRPQTSIEDLVRDHVKGPDFPTAGVLLEDEDDIIKMYTKGQGSLTLRSDWEVEPLDDGTSLIVITSVPYTVNKASLVEKIADHIYDKKLPQVVNVRDESTEDVRIVLELKKGAGHDAVMAYLFKHTPLQTRFHVNMTCLIPTDQDERCAPAKLNLKQMLWHFLDFRMDVFTRRTRFDLEALERRIHILEGYEIIFDALDEALELIRSSEGKRDAQDKLIERFELSDAQSQRVVELPLYRLAKLEIEDIRAELEDKRAQAEKLEDLLGNERKRWNAIKRELRSIQNKYADVRRTRVGGNVREFEYSEENYIVDEEYRVIVSKDGWIKRQRSYSDLSTIRVRDNDVVRYAMPAMTRGVITFFSNMGRAYTMRVDDVPSTSGYGDPVQAFFDFVDGEKVVGVLTDHADVRRFYDTEQLDEDAVTQLELGDDVDGSIVQLFAISSFGQSVRFSYSGFDEVSNRKGRIYMRLDEGDTIVNVEPGLGGEFVSLATREGRGLTFMAREISFYKGVAKGVKAVTLEDGDDVLDFTLVEDPQTGLEVETNRGAMHTIQPSLSKFAPSSRGNKGRWVIKRGHLIRAYRPAVEIITVAQEEEERAAVQRAIDAAARKAEREEQARLAALAALEAPAELDTEDAQALLPLNDDEE